MRKTIITSIILILLLTLILGVVTILFYQRSSPVSLTDKISDFFPLPANILPNNSPSPTSSTTPNQKSVLINGKEYNIPADPRLQVVTSAPAIALGSSFQSEQTSLYYLEKSSGNFIKYNPVSKQSSLLSTLESPTTEGIIFSTLDNMVYIFNITKTGDGRLNLDVLSFYLNTSTETNKKGQKILRVSENLIDLAISPDQSQFFILEKQQDGGVMGTIRSVKNPELILNTPYKSSQNNQFKVFWPISNNIYIQTNKSLLSSGDLYIININTATSSLFLQNIGNSPISFSPEGDNIIFNQILVNKLILKSKNLLTGEISTIPFSTFPNKCVWQENLKVIVCGVPKQPLTNIEYEDWSVKKMNTLDDIWEFSLNTKEHYRLLEPKSSLDVSSPILDQKTLVLYFINRISGNLESLDLNTARY